MHNNSTTEFLQKRIPKAHVFKAFNILPAPVLEVAAWSESVIQPNIFYAGNDASAGKVVRSLIIDAGFRPVNVGGFLRHALSNN